MLPASMDEMLIGIGAHLLKQEGYKGSTPEYEVNRCGVAYATRETYTLALFGNVVFSDG